MAPHLAARLRLLALCVAVLARTTAFIAVTVLSLTFLLNGDYGNFRPDALAAWLGLAAVPALILVPLIGPVVGSRWNRFALLAGTALMAAVVGWTNFDTDVPWLSVAGLLSLEAAFAWSAVLAVVPAIASATRWPRPGVSVLLMAAAAVGFVAGVRLGIHDGGPPSPVARYGFAASLIGLVGVGLARFQPAEVLSLAGGVVRPFVAGTRDAFRQLRARSALVGLWLWGFAALAVVVGAIRLAAPDLDGGVVRITITFLAAVAIGIAISAANRHPFRHGGLVLYSALTAVVCAVWLRFGESARGPLIGLGIALGAAFSPLLTFNQTWTTPRYHGVAAALVVGGWCVGALVLAAVLVNLGADADAFRPRLGTILVVLTGIAAIGAPWAFARPALEMTAEVLIWPFYRVRAVGPGVKYLPARGSCLVIGNHSAWFDPLFLAKVMPAPITPMMTSRFYDLPVLSWIMRNIIGTIRVPEKAVRHEAPELKEAVAALDGGACVILFPEGYLRRKEEQPIRRFGRGVWQILHDRPDTPVFACWIDGNWGSFFSYKDGPPTKNKRFDFWRRIRIAVTGPLTVDRRLLDDHMATRTFLMRQVSAARKPLGLEPLGVEAVTDEEKE